MFAALRRSTRRHPRARVLSGYLDGELAAADRLALERHVGDCARCRRSLDSLASTISALGSLSASSPTGVADPIIAALRAESPDGLGERARSGRARSAGRSELPALRIVRGSSQRAVGGEARRARELAGAGFRFCVRGAQLRLTLPIALLAGVALSLINQGGILMDGRIDLAMCAMCAMNFLVPFVALNVGVMIVLLVPGTKRFPGDRHRPPW